jgi:hypothetical protein
MPHDSAKADQLASSHLDGADHRTAFRAPPLRGMRGLGWRRPRWLTGDPIANIKLLEDPGKKWSSS